MQPDLEKISFENVDAVIVRNIEIDAISAFASAVHEAKADIVIFFLDGEQTIEVMSEEDMNKAGWCRCE